MGRGGSGVGHGILEAWYARDLDGDVTRNAGAAY
jgi:hypothetical protein